MPKKKKNPKKPMQRWKLYNISGNKLERKNKFCPKCGIGTFMAKHKDRIVCGNCNYVEIVKEEK
ncbi:30S ribosomal protein S27ae [Candidatus Woesearchaeota archaeon]|nr:30S ribosomal protein S27ae [Candidatus Woesearchaeota archaeon]